MDKHIVGHIMFYKPTFEPAHKKGLNSFWFFKCTCAVSYLDYRYAFFAFHLKLPQGLNDMFANIKRIFCLKLPRGRYVCKQQTLARLHFEKAHLSLCSGLWNYQILLVVHGQIKGENPLVQPRFTYPKINIFLTSRRKRMLLVLIRSTSLRCF